jgi:hypothetical protein
MWNRQPRGVKPAQRTRNTPGHNTREGDGSVLDRELSRAYRLQKKKKINVRVKERRMGVSARRTPN